MKHVHLIGIGGTGLSAIARLLLESGYEVSGSDQSMSILAKNLQDSGVTVFIGHRPENIAGADCIVRSSAIPDTNPEVIAAQQSGIPVYKRMDFLGQFMVDKTGIAVAGTHGKTTTTAMIAYLLTELGQDPSYLVGGVVRDLQSNAHSGKGNAFVIEADEYDHMFLGLKPCMIVLTSVDYDHPDCYPTPEEYLQAFRSFIATLPKGGKLIGYRDQPGYAELVPTELEDKVDVISYGTSAGCTYQAQNLSPMEGSGFAFDLVKKGEPPVSVQLSIPGFHNVLNACAALAVMDQLGVSMCTAAGMISNFRGAGRRFEVIAEISGITLVSDYAHHPTEIRSTLAAARSTYPGHRIWAVWQPHTYSRTHSLAQEFASAFSDADQVIVTDIYAAREPHQDYSSLDVVKKMDSRKTKYIASLPQVSQYLFQELKAGDVLVVLSAGDADQIIDRLIALEKEKQ